MYLDENQRFLIRDMWVRVQHMIHNLNRSSGDWHWEPIYDFAFFVMNKTFNEHGIRVDYCDIDTTYREDTEYFLLGVRELMEQNNIPTTVLW